MLLSLLTLAALADTATTTFQAENDPVAVALAARGPALADVVDSRALARRAGAGMRSSARRTIDRDVRDDAVGDLAASLLAAGERVRRLDDGPGHGIYRVLDAAGAVDYLLLDLAPNGKIEDWTWLSDGTPASVHYARGDSARKINALRLDLAVEARDWAAFTGMLERVEHVVGADPWIEFLRGVAADAQGNHHEALARIAVARKLDPSLAGQTYAPGHGG